MRDTYTASHGSAPQPLSGVTPGSLPLPGLLLSTVPLLPRAQPATASSASPRRIPFILAHVAGPAATCAASWITVVTIDPRRRRRAARRKGSADTWLASRRRQSAPCHPTPPHLRSPSQPAHAARSRS